MLSTDGYIGESIKSDVSLSLLTLARLSPCSVLSQSHVVGNREDKWGVSTPGHAGHEAKCASGS